MVFNISQRDFDYFKNHIIEAEPYTEDEFEEMLCFDGKSHVGDKRYAATVALRALLRIGFSEDEVNPWKKKQ